MHFTAVVVASLPIFAAATAAPQALSRRDCDTSNLQCCQSTQTVNPTSLAVLGGLLGLVLPAFTGLVGLTCSPLTIIGGGGSSCSAQPVCCTNNSFNGAIALGCTPVNINV